MKSYCYDCNIIDEKPKTTHCPICKEPLVLYGEGGIVLRKRAKEYQEWAKENGI